LTVGIVIVSHSATLAEGVVELARQMAGEDVKIEAAGGLDMPDHPLGTDAALVLQAIERADSGDGVLVLMDLGSAVMSAEMAVEMLQDEQREKVLLTSAPLVEGAVAAAVTARLGAPLEQVAEEARGGLQPKAEHLGAEGKESAAEAEAQPAVEEGAVTARLSVRNPLGLHARPAARFVQTAGSYDARVTVRNLTTGRGPASGRSLNAVATLGVRQGHEIEVQATGPQSEQVVEALQELAARNFDEEIGPEPSTSLRTAPRETAATTPARPASPKAATAKPLPPPEPGAILTGLPASPGIAVAPARLFRPPVPEVPTRQAEDPDAEWSALQQSIEAVRNEIRQTRSSVAARAGEYHAGIFDAHLLFLEDEALLEPARRLIFDEKRNAGDAWNRASEEMAAQYRSLEDEYMRARADDVTAVARQVVAHLIGQSSAAKGIEAAGILVAAELTPADTAGLDTALVHAIATAFGGPTSHSAILSRSLGIPAVVGLGERLLGVTEGAALALDGVAGTVIVEPSAEITRDYRARGEARREAERRARSAAHEPAVTRDGRRIEVVANAGSVEDVRAAVAGGAEGVGLLRTEFLFVGRTSLPDEEEQYSAYRQLAETLEGRPMIVRTLDVGADKPLAYLPRPPEANPFLGVRGIRLALAEPELLSTQLRAILRVAVEFPLKVMFPMVATLEELRRAEGLVRQAREELAGRGAPMADRIDVGMMVEVPAAALGAERFAPEVDFFSIGTNDLSQYTMAADRGNEHVAALADALEPAVLRLIGQVVDAAEAHGKWVGVCGELAGDPLATPVLVGLGVRELSMSPPSIPSVKQAVRDVDLAGARALADKALSLESAAAVRTLLAE
jgi:phosphoenolpyruvate-protein phosphotransferase/dihydroxyacetone kinase phosphotransfer subunit